jgi:hypothetical protein
MPISLIYSHFALNIQTVLNEVRSYKGGEGSGQLVN